MGFNEVMSTVLTYEALLDQNLEWALIEGSIHFYGHNAVHKTLRRIASRLDDLGVDYAIAGGMALFFHGYRRFTEGVDVLVAPAGLAIIHDRLEGHGYIRPFEKSKNLRDAETRVRIDFLETGQFPGDGKPGPISFPAPSDVAVELEGIRVVDLPAMIQLKLASGKDAGRMKDLADVQEMIRILRIPRDFEEKLDPSLRASFASIWQSAQGGDHQRF
jgi:hypothetical protein